MKILYYAHYLVLKNRIFIQLISRFKINFSQTDGGSYRVTKPHNPGSFFIDNNFIYFHIRVPFSHNYFQSKHVCKLLINSYTTECWIFVRRFTGPFHKRSRIYTLKFVERFEITCSNRFNLWDSFKFMDKGCSQTSFHIRRQAV